MKIDFNKYPLPKRLRHHTSPNVYFSLKELKYIPENYPPVFENLDWKEIFLNGKPPFSLDIGCGKGAFLFDFAEANDSENILGLEVRKPLAEWLNHFIKSENIQNCSSLWYSVANGLPFIESNSINNIFYFFPDPWPKTKHSKRRVLNLDFLNEAERLLSPDGALYIATDLYEIHEYHIKILNKHSKFSFSIIESDNEWNLPLTNKENFCRLNNIQYWRVKCKKRPPLTPPYEGGEIKS
jgi:tRNA (guanine-N7-)-methyltransferase